MLAFELARKKVRTRKPNFSLQPWSLHSKKKTSTSRFTVQSSFWEQNPLLRPNETLPTSELETAFSSQGMPHVIFPTWKMMEECWKTSITLSNHLQVDAPERLFNRNWWVLGPRRLRSKRATFLRSRLQSTPGALPQDEVHRVLRAVEVPAELVSALEEVEVHPTQGIRRAEELWPETTKRDQRAPTPTVSLTFG